ncbi:hypothetical protein H696_04804 [Fonticula alba]|uniref:Uncharacterized protein n=1 Tax=Fonticula alba TaxID=691883 RepID=A0A058Z4U5_FONAL|nr:hypothetical protein H696_04804 [Fonticula alba]KCV68512.1 hypothetical protein H696_04804 [Fonticula alba]|eukprot:XP_009496944.1 hypothetical protein H696_04804 [Fonticula alba]
MRLACDRVWRCSPRRDPPGDGPGAAPCAAASGAGLPCSLDVLAGGGPEKLAVTNT